MVDVLFANTSIMKFYSISQTHPCFQQTLDLRQRVLRQPLGLNLFQENLSAEQDQLIFIAEEQSLVLGCLLLQPLGQGVFKLRQMAVHPEWQGKGIGKQLMQTAEVFAGEAGAQKIILHARATALNFYEKLGYQKKGKPFVEVGITH